MKNIDKNQKSLNVYRICELLKKICIETDRGNGGSYTINKKEIKMTIKVIKRKSVLKN